jgi:hypothetical protein
VPPPWARASVADLADFDFEAPVAESQSADSTELGDLFRARDAWSRHRRFRRRIMTDWSLSVLLAGLHDDIQRKLETVRKSFGHPGTKGDASEKVWLELLETYLPKR